MPRPPTVLQLGSLHAGESPSLLLFYHVPKTGGTTTREWLTRNAGVRAPRGAAVRLTSVVKYYEADCFFCLQFARLVSAGCTKERMHRCHNWRPYAAASFDSVHGDWRRSRLAVEFHAGSAGFYLEHVVPALPALRELYARHNGSVVSATLVREPVSFLFSSYYMWPPRPDKRRSDVTTPFPQWVGHAAGLQAGFFTTPSCTNSSRSGGQRSHCGCRAAARREALSTLSHFDVVGVTACLPSFMDAVEVAMRLPVDSALVRLQRRAYKGNATAGPMRAQPRCSECSRSDVLAWNWEALDAETRARTLRVASCDDELYSIAMRRMRRAYNAQRVEACVPPMVKWSASSAHERLRLR
jgi:hypothetical protein